MLQGAIRFLGVFFIIWIILGISKDPKDNPNSTTAEDTLPQDTIDINTTLKKIGGLQNGR